MEYFPVKGSTNMFRSRSGHSVTREELAAINRKRDAEQWDADFAIADAAARERMMLADQPRNLFPSGPEAWARVTVTHADGRLSFARVWLRPVKHRYQQLQRIVASYGKLTPDALSIEVEILK